MSGEQRGLHRECFQPHLKRERSHSVCPDLGSPNSPFLKVSCGGADGANGTEGQQTETSSTPLQRSPPLFELIPLSTGASEGATPTSAPAIRFGVEGIRIGRDPGCSDLVLDSAAVSRLHCVLSVLGDEVFVHDNSFNGTFINGRRVGRGRCSVLHPHDTLSFMNPTCSGSELHSFEFAHLAGHTSRGFPVIEGMQRYEVGPVVGQGSFAAVRLATDRETGAAVAVKLIERHRLCSDEAAASLHVEIEMMRGMHHPNIVRVLDAFEGSGCVALVMEYVRGGDLFDYVVGRGRNPFTEEEARHLFVQLLEAVRYIHGRNIIHCDLKPENVLVDYAHADAPALGGDATASGNPAAGDSGADPQAGEAILTALDNHQAEAKALSPFDVRLKLTDFGVAKYGGGTAQEDAAAEAGGGGVGGGGTPVYAAPELAAFPPDEPEDLSGDDTEAHAAQLRVTSAVDVWSLGVLLYILCSGTVPKPPPPGATVVLHRGMGHLSASCTDLITRMMVADPSQRISLAGVCHHPWLDGVELCGGAQRNGGGGVMDEDDRDSLSITTVVSPRFYRSVKPPAAPRSRKGAARTVQAANGNHHGSNSALP